MELGVKPLIIQAKNLKTHMKKELRKTEDSDIFKIEKLVKSLRELDEVITNLGSIE